MTGEGINTMKKTLLLVLFLVSIPPTTFHCSKIVDNLADWFVSDSDEVAMGDNFYKHRVPFNINHLFNAVISSSIAVRTGVYVIPSSFSALLPSPLNPSFMVLI